ncbi:MAG: DUF177 domain-containing protein [Clostridia bacterium]|nr:DUF177 domain-containing protein [Clostridia bacterium]MBN2882675.1 DUF177 domain-containing protein [Clostridia bacterium]
MRIDITEIAGMNGAYISVEKDIPSSELISGKSDVTLGESIHIDLKIEYIEGMIIVSGVVSGTYHAVCGRCLADIDEKFNIELHENFMHASDTNNDSDDYNYEGWHIDLASPLIDNILLDLPSVMLCREDCRGLCISCGKNLNDGDCSCDLSDHGINLQMEKLKDFFD